MTADPATQTPTQPDAAAAMDRMYRYTRHVYDASRRFYLFGRDTLIREMDVRDGDAVVEIGCGTARNLIKLAKRYPNAHCFGIDAAHVMIETARKNIAKAGLSDRVTVRQGLAQNLSPAMFDRDEPFDVTYFSYSLSMIPPWKESVDAAVAATKPGRTVYSVDFWDQSGYPAWFRAILQKWLDLFHVHFHPELLEYLKTVAQQQGSELQLKPIGKQYAYIAAVKTKR